jgi:tRNA(fMet)-specific endonuclease VapC
MPGCRGLSGRDPQVLYNALEYLQEHRVFRCSIITRYEVLRGLHAKDARQQITAFLDRCRASVVCPMTEEIVDRAAEIYGSLRKRGQLISEGDLLMAERSIGKLNATIG